MQNMKGRVAVITGAGSGIGRGLAIACGAEEMHLVLADIQADALADVVDELRTAGCDVGGMVTDVAERAQVDALAKFAFDRHGTVHLLCNNAGVIDDNLPSWACPPADWQWVLGVNLMGVVHGIEAFVPRMLERGEPGHIVNTASIGGLVTTTANTPYTVSKHAVIALSECLYKELEARQASIGVSALCPGWVATGIADADRNRPAARDLGAAEQGRRERLRAAIGEGMDLLAVGRLVIEAVQEGRFYIKTHPHWDHTIEERFAAILDGRRPATTRLPRE